MQFQRLRRADMSLIRSAMGAPPRRLSDAFLHGERCALHAHRARCRRVYEQHDPRAPLPAGVPPQCAVGHSVTARHPRLRTIHDGDVLTVSTSTYMVQFHRSELGVSRVHDTDVARAQHEPAAGAAAAVPPPPGGGAASRDEAVAHADAAQGGAAVQSQVRLRLALLLLLLLCATPCQAARASMQQ